MEFWLVRAYGSWGLVFENMKGIGVVEGETMIGVSTRAKKTPLNL
jgi:hypothetical protein